jgi:hypothetical protein
MGRRKGNQNGSVLVVGPKWRGKFRVYSATGVRFRSIALGLVSEMSREEAQEKLRTIVKRTDLCGRVRHELRPNMLIEPATICPGLSDRAPAKGVVAELIVAADLQSKGYEVFRPVSPISPCDLLAMDSNWNVLRVQVKKATTSATGAIRCNIRKDLGRFDMLAIMVDSKRIEYRNAADVVSSEYPLREHQPTRGKNWVRNAE